jgi:hypothetical protein
VKLVRSKENFLTSSGRIIKVDVEKRAREFLSEKKRKEEHGNWVARWIRGTGDTSSVGH